MASILQQSETKAFYKSVVALVLPMALQNLINVAVTSADVIMLGKVGETALSASSLAGQVQFIVTLIFFGLTSGTAVLTAQYWGKNDVRTIEKVMGIALRFSLLIGLLFSVAVFFFPRQTMMIFSSEEPVIREGIQYLRIVAATYTLNAFTMVYLNIMRSVERVIISTVVYLVSLITNVLINALLIFGMFGLPKLGIVGAAIGTLIARAVEVVIVFIYAKRNPVVKLRFQDIFVRDKLLFQDFLKFSIPVTINEMMWGLGASMNAVIIGHMGSTVVAANSVAQVTRQLSTVVAFGISSAAAIMLGKAIGAGKSEEAERNSKRFLKLTMLASLGGAIIILIVRPIAMAHINLSDVSRDYLSMMMFVMAYFTVAQAYNSTMVVGIFRSGGDTKFGLFLDVSTMWGFSILFGAICAFVLNLNVTVVYMVLMSDEIIKIPLTTWRYKKKYWLRDVTR